MLVIHHRLPRELNPGLVPVPRELNPDLVRVPRKLNPGLVRFMLNAHAQILYI